MTYLLVLLAGAALWALVLMAVRRFKTLRQWNWLAAAAGEVPWASVRNFAVIGGAHGHNDIMFVSRHDIAECGLTCPNCQTMAAERGDFSSVRRSMINGRENEVVKCTGRVEIDTLIHQCPVWLAASPDTEHGDHLNDDGTFDTLGENEPPEFFVFKRITPEQALREKYGADIVTAGSGVEIDENTRIPMKTGTKHDVLVGEELLQAIQRDQEAEIAKQAAAAAKDVDATPVVGTPVTELPKDSPNV